LPVSAAGLPAAPSWTCKQSLDAALLTANAAHAALLATVLAVSKTVAALRIVLERHRLAGAL
jgi:hypothetical protein